MPRAEPPATADDGSSTAAAPEPSMTSVSTTTVTDPSSVNTESAGVEDAESSQGGKPTQLESGNDLTAEEEALLAAAPLGPRRGCRGGAAGRRPPCSARSAQLPKPCRAFMSKQEEKVQFLKHFGNFYLCHYWHITELLYAQPPGGARRTSGRIEVRLCAGRCKDTK